METPQEDSQEEEDPQERVSLITFLVGEACSAGLIVRLRNVRVADNTTITIVQIGGGAGTFIVTESILGDSVICTNGDYSFPVRRSRSVWIRFFKEVAASSKH